MYEKYTLLQYITMIKCTVFLLVNLAVGVPIKIFLIISHSHDKYIFHGLHEHIITIHNMHYNKVYITYLHFTTPSKNFRSSTAPKFKCNVMTAMVIGVKSPIYIRLMHYGKIMFLISYNQSVTIPRFST